MRIVHVTDCYLPRLGGIELHVRDLVTHQRAEGHDARVVTAAAVHPAVADPLWVERMGAGWRTALPARLARADVVHVHASVFSPFATWGARSASQLGVPTVGTIHSMWSNLHALPTVLASLIDLRTWPVVWSAVSEASAQPVRRALGGAVDVHVLHNAVDVSRWQARPLPADVVPTVISVMRLTPTKRPLPLARALRRVRRDLPADQPLRAVIVGEGGRQASLERYLARHGMDWVELPGRLSREEIRAELGRSCVYVAPAERESFGLAALEARCAGLPVVADRRSGVVEFIEDGVSGLLFDDDRGMAHAISRLLTDDSLRLAVAAHNLNPPVGVDWAAATAGCDRLYAMAVARSGRRPMRELELR